jgi:hypothetical protein
MIAIRPNRTRAKAVEMTVRGKPGKTKNRFSTLSTALGNRSAIPTFPQPRRAEEK